MLHLCCRIIDKEVQQRRSKHCTDIMAMLRYPYITMPVIRQCGDIASVSGGNK